MWEALRGVDVVLQDLKNGERKRGREKRGRGREIEIEMEIPSKPSNPAGNQLRRC
jgi:hypothetical protein